MRSALPGLLLAVTLALGATTTVAHAHYTNGHYYRGHGYYRHGHWYQHRIWSHGRYYYSR